MTSPADTETTPADEPVAESDHEPETAAEAAELSEDASAEAADVSEDTPPAEEAAAPDTTPADDRLPRTIAFQSELAGASCAPDQALQTVTEFAQHITAATAASIELVDGDEMVYRTASGSSSSCVGLRVPLDASLSGLALRTGEPQLLVDADNDPRVDRDAWRKAELRSSLCVPVLCRGEHRAVLRVTSPQAGAFGDFEVALLQLLGGLVASVLAQERLVEHLAALSHGDLLTGLPNRRGFEAEAKRRLDLTRRKLVGSVLVMADLDNFAHFNERHGRLEGDRLLQDCADRWSTELRAHDILARWGGGSFVMLLTDCMPRDALAVCERVRTLTPAGQTFSAGVVVDDFSSSLSDLVSRASEAVASAKRAGRNRTVVDAVAGAA